MAADRGATDRPTDGGRARARANHGGNDVDDCRCDERNRGKTRGARTKTGKITDGYGNRRATSKRRLCAPGWPRSRVTITERRLTNRKYYTPDTSHTHTQTHTVKRARANVTTSAGQYVTTGGGGGGGSSRTYGRKRAIVRTDTPSTTVRTRTVSVFRITCMCVLLTSQRDVSVCVGKVFVVQLSGHDGDGDRPRTNETRRCRPTGRCSAVYAPEFKPTDL